MSGSNSFFNSNDSLVKKAASLRITAKDLAEGMKNGNFRSMYKGQGIEFSGVRDYIRGDDIRSIDWNVTARMGRPYVKIFDEERELQIFVILDASASMQLKTDSPRTKYESAAEATALISIAAELNNCSLGAVFFDGDTYFSCKPEPGRNQTMLVLTHLDKIHENPKDGSVLGNAITGAGKLLRKRSLVFVFSDFRAAEWEKPLISLAQKNDVIAVRLSDSFDRELPSMGTIRFEDSETHQKMTLPSSSQSFKRAWKDFSKDIEAGWKDCCLRHGIMPVLMDTKKEPVHVLSEIFGAHK